MPAKVEIKNLAEYPILHGCSYPAIIVILLEQTYIATHVVTMMFSD